MGLQRTTEPAEQPLSMAAVKEYLKVDVGDEDALIAGLVKSAVSYAEDFTRRALISQVWALTLDCFPTIVRIPRPPLISIDQIDYIDAAGDPQTLDAANYTESINYPHYGTVCPAFGMSWPETQAVPEAVTIQFTAGYADSEAIPQGLRQALLWLCEFYHKERMGNVVSPFEARNASIDRLLIQHEVPAF